MAAVGKASKFCILMLHRSSSSSTSAVRKETLSKERRNDWFLKFGPKNKWATPEQLAIKGSILNQLEDNHEQDDRRQQDVIIDPKVNRELTKGGRRFSYDCQSLAQRGFLRSQKHYSPPQDLNARFISIVEKVFDKRKASSEDGNKESGSDVTAHQGWKQSEFNALSLDNNRIKYNFLTTLAKEFDHEVSDMILHEIKSVGDAYRYYSTSVESKTPLEQLKDIDLPKNLHVLYEYSRFDPEHNPLFNNMDAFPQNSTVVTGLRAKQKYQSFVKEKSFPVDD